MAVRALGTGILPECMCCLTTVLADFVRGDTFVCKSFAQTKAYPPRSLLEARASLIDHGRGSLETRSCQGLESNIWKHMRPCI